MSLGEFFSYQSRFERMEKMYQIRFSQKSRLTRDLRAMDALITEAQALLAGETSVDSEFVSQVTGALELYQNERREIVLAKESAGPWSIEAEELRARAQVVFHCYVRHFAGKSRASRDGLLLAEMMDDLTEIAGAMDKLALNPHFHGGDEAREAVSGYLELFKKEQDGIVEARKSGDLGDQAGNLGGVANGYFQAYGIHFAGKSRVSRRPELLERIIAGLKQTLAGMLSLSQSGLSATFNDDNMRIVREKLAFYSDEIGQIKLARNNLNADQLANHLGHAANQITQEFHRHFTLGEDAEEQGEPGVLAGLCDRLREVERQMRDLDTDTTGTTNGQNLMSVMDTLAVYQRHYDRLVDVGPMAGSAEPVEIV